MTDERAAGAPAASPSFRPSRAARQAPGDLTFALDPAYVEARASHEPDWLAAARRAAFDRFQALPVEGNRLYTTYLDLRLAQLEDVTPWPRPATRAADQAAGRPGRPGSPAWPRTGSRRLTSPLRPWPPG